MLNMCDKKRFYQIRAHFVNAHVREVLKVPKREIFDRWDFPDFYTIQSLREGDFGVKI